jgi:hypothetical protein
MNFLSDDTVILLKLSLMSCLKPTRVVYATQKIGVVQNVELAHFTTTDNQLC